MLGKQASDLCTSTLTQYFVREYFAEGRWREYIDDLVGIYRERRDAMLDALERHFPARRRGRSPRAGSSSGRRCPTTSTPPTCSPRRCARTSPSSPARPRTSTAAAASMRLNFSALQRGGDPRGHPADRRRHRRAGGALTTGSSNRARRWSPTHPEPAASAVPVHAGRRPSPGRADEGRGAERRPVTGARRCRCAPGPGSRTRSRALGHEVVAIDADEALVRELKDERPDVAFIALHGPGGEDGTVQALLEMLGISYTGPGVAACVRCTDKVVAKHRCARPGYQRPTGSPSEPPPSASWGRRRVRRDRGRLGLPLVVKPAARRLRSGSPVRRLGRRRPRP